MPVSLSKSDLTACLLMVRRTADHYANCTGLDVEDLYSAGCEGLSVAVNSYDPARGASFKTWAYHSVRGYIGHEIDRQAKHRPNVSLDDYEQAHGEIAGPADTAPSDLTEYLARLTDRQQEVFRLRYVEGLRYAEIAVRIGKSVGMTRWIHSQGLARLRRFWAGRKEDLP